MSIKVIVECDPDELLAKALGLNKKEIKHQPNKGEVCNLLQRTDISVGIIDEDPGSGQPKYLKTFTVVEEKFGIKWLTQKNTRKNILIIKPRLEEWLIIQCAQSNIQPGRFHLPDNAKRLKAVINIRLHHLKDLLQGLTSKENRGLRYLQKIIQLSYK